MSIGSFLNLSVKISSHNARILKCQVDRMAHQIGFDPVTVEKLDLARVLSFEKPSVWPLNGEWSLLSINVNAAHLDEEGDVYLRFDINSANLIGIGKK